MWPKNFHFEFNEDAAYAQAAGNAPSVPGTGEDDLGGQSDITPPGDTTETPPVDHGPVPYSRFKEVNDRRRQLEETMQPYVSLESTGYGADDLHRLVAWEQEYLQDPSEAWLRQAEQIDALPDSVKQAIALVREGAAKGNPPADGGPPGSTESDDGSSNEPPEWGKVLLSDYERRTAREEREAHQALVDAMVKAWDDTDSQLGIKTPKETQLIYLQAASSQEGTPAEIFVRAHKAWMEGRESILSQEVRPPGDGSTVPRSVPGSVGAPPQAPPVRPKTLREATKAAAAAEAAGKLIMVE